MIINFGDRISEDIFYDRPVRPTRQLGREIYRSARRKVLYLHDAAELKDLRTPPGNRLEKLRGDWAGHYSIRINSQWQVVFRWESGGAADVQIVDYH